MSFFSFHPWSTIIINSMLHGTALHLHNSSGSGSLKPGHGVAGGHLPYKAILLSSVPAVTGSIAAVICAWHSDRVKEKHLHVAVPWLLSGVFLGLFGPMTAISFVVGFITLVLAKTLSAASSGVSSSLLVGEALHEVLHDVLATHVMLTAQHADGCCYGRVPKGTQMCRTFIAL